jgi:hypothetical protein
MFSFSFVLEREMLTNRERQQIDERAKPACACNASGGRGVSQPIGGRMLFGLHIRNGWARVIDY